MFRAWGEKAKRQQPEPGPRSPKEAAAARADVALVRAAPPTTKNTELSLFPNILLEPKKTRRNVALAPL